MPYQVIADEHDHVKTVIVGLWTAWIATFIVTALRAWSQIISKRAIGWDDILINYSCVSHHSLHCQFCSIRFAKGTQVIHLIYTVLMTLAALSGFGKPRSTVIPPEQLLFMNKMIFISEILILSIFSIGKSSVAIFQLRIVIVRWQRYLLWYIVITVNLAYYVDVLWDILQCSPTAHIWNPSIPAKCDFKSIVPYAVFLGGRLLACFFFSRFFFHTKAI